MKPISRFLYENKKFLHKMPQSVFVQNNKIDNEIDKKQK